MPRDREAAGDQQGNNGNGDAVFRDFYPRLWRCLRITGSAAGANAVPVALARPTEI
jgi:hypothetical protein